MMDESLAAMLDKIMPCLTAKIGGRNQAVVARRRAIAEFFHYCAVYAAPVKDLQVGVAFTHLAGYSDCCADALDRLLDEPAGVDELSQRIYEEIDEVWQILVDAMQPIENALAADRQDEASEACCRALLRVFDWEANGHHRVHVFIRTGQKLEDGLLGKERSLFLKAVRECLTEMNP
jgi:hypothetical protein